MACSNSSKERKDAFESILNSLKAEYVALSTLCEHREREIARLRSYFPAEAYSPCVYLDRPEKDQHPEVPASTLTEKSKIENLGKDLKIFPVEAESTEVSLRSRDVSSADSADKDQHSEVPASTLAGKRTIEEINVGDVREDPNLRGTANSNDMAHADSGKADPTWKRAATLLSIGGDEIKGGSYCARIGIAGGIILPILLLIAMQGVVLWLWPPCQDGVPCEDQQSQLRLMRSFARDVVPDLKKYEPNFFSMGQATSSAPNSERDCIGPLINWLHLTLGGFVTNPSTVNDVLEHIGIANLTLVRDAMGELLTSPYDYTSLLNVSAGCAHQNPMLNSYICAAVDDPSLRPMFISSDEISISMHLFLVLEKLAIVGRDSSALYSLLGEHFQRTSTDTEAKIVDYSRRAGVSAQLEKFRMQKWQSVELSGSQRLNLKQDPLNAGNYFQYNAMVNILEATRVDHSVGVTNNVDLGLALGASVSTHWPYVDADNKVQWNFGKDWINAYVAWNMNYVLQLGLSSYIAKLAIPSVLCASDPGVATPAGWLPPEPSLWFAARSVSLKSAMAYIADRKLTLSETFKYDIVMSHQTRNRWALITKQQANLPHPPECCGQGSLKAMYDRALPYHTDIPTPTSVLSDEHFLVYTTLLLWATVMVCGYSAEVLIGGKLLTLFGQHGKTYWKSVQLVFPGCLTIAIFSQSVFGLPFLWLGLWKGGVPETLGSLMHGIATFRTNRMQGASSYITAVGLVVHHGATSFIICSVMRGLFPLSRPLACACSIPVLQHLVAPVRYIPKVGHNLYTVTEIALEVWFEIEVIANIDSFETVHGFDITRLARGFAISMLVSHWLYLLSGALDIIASRLSKAEDEDEDDAHVKRKKKYYENRLDSFMVIEEHVKARPSQ